MGMAEERLAALSLRDAIVRYGANTILDVPELSLARGETVTLIGPNGAGKSTLLQIAALLRPPDQGEVWIGGERAGARNRLRLRRRIAMVFQDPLLFDRSVLANASAGVRFHGAGRRDAERIAIGWLERFGVGALARRNARSLSGGEAQRVSLARAFATDPELLLLDEPFTTLDAPTRSALVPDLAARLRESGTAALIVTHDQTEALALGERLGIMLGGRIAQFGPPAEVLARPAEVAVAAFLGISNLMNGHVGAADGWVEVCLGACEEEPRICVRVAAEPGVTWRTGAAVTVALHPRQLTVYPMGITPSVGWNAHAGLVQTATLTPAGQDLTLTYGGLTLLASVPRLPAGALFIPGQPVIAAFDPAAAHVIGA
ncbi:MAG: ABC transporter ATP-binding protein [Chloroflexota bacterium]|nr:ABC transporter ATP-binding protein [Chloroflexota bacterium]